jgi:hypothetical protein
MSPKNDRPEPTPPATESPDATPRKKTTRSVRKPAVKTKAASEAAVAGASEKAASKPRRKTPAVAASSAPDRTEGEAASDASGRTQSFEHEVRVRAYMLSLERGDGPGSSDADWFQAEREVASSRL